MSSVVQIHTIRVIKTFVVVWLASWMSTDHFGKLRIQIYKHLYLSYFSCVAYLPDIYTGEQCVIN